MRNAAEGKLAIVVMQADPVEGVDAFWITRPILGARLLATKLLGLVLLLWLAPVAVALPWWLGHGFGWREVGQAAMETARHQAMITAVAWPAAVLSRRMGRFLLFSLLLWVFPLFIQGRSSKAVTKDVRASPEAMAWSDRTSGGAGQKP